MFRRTGDLRRAIVAAATLGLVLAPLAAAASLPKAVDFWGMRPNALATRPGALAWTPDLGPSFNGTRGSSRGRGPASKLSWGSWNAPRLETRSVAQPSSAGHHWALGAGAEWRGGVPIRPPRLLASPAV